MTTTRPSVLYMSLRLGAPQPSVFYDGKLRTEWKYPDDGVVLIRHRAIFQKCLDRISTPEVFRGEYSLDTKPVLTATSGGAAEKKTVTKKKTTVTKKKKTASKKKTAPKKKAKKERRFVFNSMGTAQTHSTKYNWEDSVESGFRWWTKIDIGGGKWEVVRNTIPGIQCPKKPRTFIHNTWSDAYHRRAIYNVQDKSKPWKWICLGSEGVPGPTGKWETVKVPY